MSGVAGPPMPTDLRQLAEDYFVGIRSRDIEVMVAKFAPDGTMILPDGREVTGHEALRAMYGGLFAADPPTPTPLNFIVAADQVAVEIEARLGDGSRRATANVFRFDPSGRIARVSIYRRG